MRLALYQPDIPQNVGAAIRVAACFDAGLDIIGPAGFPLSSKALRRAAMDYGELATPAIHDSWTQFQASLGDQRLVLLTTTADQSIWDFEFSEADVILMGRESAGAPSMRRSAKRSCNAWTSARSLAVASTRMRPMTQTSLLGALISCIPAGTLPRQAGPCLGDGSATYLRPLRPSWRRSGRR